MIPPLATLRTMPGSAVLVALRDAAFAEAARIEGVATAVRFINPTREWDEGRMQSYLAMVALGKVAEWAIAAGQEAKLRKKTLDPMIVAIADIARAALVIEREKQAGRFVAEPTEGADVVTAA